MVTLIGKQDLINSSFKDPSYLVFWFYLTYSTAPWLSCLVICGMTLQGWYWELRLKVLVAQSSPTLCNPMEEWVAIPFNPNPGIKPWSPTLQADSLLSEPQGYTLSIKKLNFCQYESYKSLSLINFILSWHYLWAIEWFQLCYLLLLFNF